MPTESQRRERRPYQRRETVPDDLQFELSIGPRKFQLGIQPDPGDDEHPIITAQVRPALNVMDLTVVTEAEIEALRAFWNDALDAALIVVRDLDRLAKEANERGETTYKRLWRPDPVRRTYRDPVDTLNTITTQPD